MESVKQRIADLESAGKVVGGLSLSSEFELSCLRELVAVTAHSERVSKSLETALGVQADQAKRTNQLLGEIKKAEAVIGSLGWMGLDTAISLELTKLNKQISDLQGQVSLLTEQRDALVVENVALKDALEYVINPDNQPGYHDQGMGCGVEDHGYQRNGYAACSYGWESAMERVYSEVIPDALPETPATSSAIAALRSAFVDEAVAALSDSGAQTFGDCVLAICQLRESKGEVQS